MGTVTRSHRCMRAWTFAAITSRDAKGCETLRLSAVSRTLRVAGHENADWPPRNQSGRRPRIDNRHLGLAISGGDACGHAAPAADRMESRDPVPKDVRAFRILLCMPPLRRVRRRRPVLRVRLDPQRCRRAALHHDGLFSVRADDSVGLDLDKRLDPAAVLNRLEESRKLLNSNVSPRAALERVVASF